MYIKLPNQNTTPSTSNRTTTRTTKRTTTRKTSTSTSTRTSSTTRTAPASTSTSTQTRTTTTAGSCQSQFQASVLRTHNKLRASHQVPSLVQNVTITNIAQSYSQYLAKNGLFQHSGATNFGENIYLTYSTGNLLSNCTAFGERCVQSWYSEVSSYDFSNPGSSSGTGHFTQIVWKSTTDLGCGVASGVKLIGSTTYNAAYCVCNYYPPGNYYGQYRANVFPKL